MLQGQWYRVVSNVHGSMLGICRQGLKVQQTAMVVVRLKATASSKLNCLFVTWTGICLASALPERLGFCYRDYYWSQSYVASPFSITIIIAAVSGHHSFSSTATSFLLTLGDVHYLQGLQQRPQTCQLAAGRVYCRAAPPEEALRCSNHCL